MDEIDELCYWDFIGVTKYQSKTNDRQSGKTTYKELKPSQKKMIEERKKQQGKK